MMYTKDTIYLKVTVSDKTHGKLMKRNKAPSYSLIFGIQRFTAYHDLCILSDIITVGGYTMIPSYTPSPKVSIQIGILTNMEI